MTDYFLDGRVTAEIDNETYRAVEKHGFVFTPACPDMPDAEKLVILVEEVGEVARALTYDEGDDDNLYDELIQVAAMAAMWAESVRFPDGK